MRTLYGWLLIILPGVIVLAAVLLRHHLCNLLPYSSIYFHGDGQIRDNGPWMYPRYELLLSEVELNRSGKHVFYISGVPKQLTFCLRIPWDEGEQKSFESEAQLRTRTFDTIVTVSIANPSGRTICEYSAPLSEWTLAVSPACAEYWHPNCRDVDFQRNQQYCVLVQIDCNDTQESLVAQPVLKGGGSELP